MGSYGFVTAELPNPDVEPSQRIITLPIKHKNDYSSIYKAFIDTGVKTGTNELVLVYEHRRNLFGRHKACIHLAAYPKGTWNTFFEAVTNYAAKEFQWPIPLFLFRPSTTRIFPNTLNDLSS